MDFQINLLEEINTCFEVLTAATYFLLLLSTAVGKCIYFLLNYIISSIITISNYFHRVLIIFYEDFTIFCQDLVLILCKCLQSSQDVIIKSYNFITRSSWIIVEKFTLLSKTNIFPRTDTICLFFNQLKEWFILIGNSFWLIGTSFAYIFYWIVEFIYTSTISTVFTFYDLCDKFKFNVVQYVTDVPYQALCGFMLAITLIVNRKYVLLAVFYLIRVFGTYISRFLLIFLSHFRQLVQSILLRILMRNQLYDWIRNINIINFSRMSTNTIRTENINNHNVRIETNEMINVSSYEQTYRSPAEYSSSTSATASISNRNEQYPKQPSPKTDAFCVICQDRVKCIVLLPCKHLCLCHECAINWSRYQRYCPLCRKFIEDTLKVFT